MSVFRTHFFSNCTLLYMTFNFIVVHKQFAALGTLPAVHVQLQTVLMLQTDVCSQLNQCESIGQYVNHCVCQRVSASESVQVKLQTVLVLQTDVSSQLNH